MIEDNFGGNMKFLLIFVLLKTLIFSIDSYNPVNEKENAILKTYRKKKINLILSTSNSKDNLDYNNILIEIFRDYLKLNINIIYKEYNMANIPNKEGVYGEVLTNLKNYEKVKFTMPIYDQNLYIASNELEINNLQDLKNQKIYIPENTGFLDYCEFYFRNENISYIPVKVRLNLESRDRWTVVTDLNSFKYKNKMKIGTLPSIAIGITKDLSDLIPIVNNALIIKYKSQITNSLKNRKNSIFKEKFLNVLTEEEKKYLEKLDPISLSYRFEEKINNFSKDREEFGLLPFIIEKMQLRYGIKFDVSIDEYKTRNESYKSFENKEVRVIPLAKTSERIEKYLFTDKIYSSQLSVITNFNSYTSKIGVVDNSIELSNAKFFNNKNNIKIYDDQKSLLKDLKLGKLRSIYLKEADKFDFKGYHIKKISDIDISFALHKEDIILHRILNKAINNLIDIASIQEEIKKIRQQEEIIEYQESKVKNNMYIILLAAMSIIIIIAFYKIILQKKIEKSLEKDSLTGLQNREKFNKFSVNIDENTYGTALFIDIDNFKSVNDIHGHSKGDELIKVVGEYISSVFGLTNSYRIAGDEFYVFNSDDTFVEKILVLENIIKTSKHKLSLSIGYYINKNKIPLEKAFKFADMAMYEAKKINGFSYLEATDALIKKKQREYNIKYLLRENVVGDVFAVFQPKFCLDTMQITGIEALARWNSGLFGPISPGEFIPLAEEIKRVYLIDYKIAEEALKFIKMLKIKNLVDRDFRVAINLSMETLEKEDVVSRINDLLSFYDVPGEWLEIEITESILSSNLNKTIKKLEEIRDLNIRISIDDFTAGHSTANLLTLLPISCVKFDKSILDIIDNKNIYNYSIYRNLIHLITDLNLNIVSEGIETEYQLNFLKSNGVKVGQGFIFSKPLIKEEVIKLIENQKLIEI